MNTNGGGDAYRVEINGDVYEVEFRGKDGIVMIDGEEIQLDVRPKSVPDHYSMLGNGESYIIAVEPRDEPNQYRVHAGGYDFDADVISKREAFLRDYLRAAGVGKAEGRIKAPMPGLIIKIEMQEGEDVLQGDSVLVMEAMKMENEIKAPISGTLKELNVREGDAVEKGQILFEIVTSSDIA
ncbi:biotin/lipoyl-binding protein [bacterium]|nr:biotin/lipoyl-binding protein [bacterium]